MAEFYHERELEKVTKWVERTYGPIQQIDSIGDGPSTHIDVAVVKQDDGIYRLVTIGMGAKGAFLTNKAVYSELSLCVANYEALSPEIISEIKTWLFRAIRGY